MFTRICLAFALLAGTAAWCQTETPASEVSIGSEADVDLKVPPPVSMQAYSTGFEGEKESNYLFGGVTFTSAYSSNVAWSGQPVSDMSYSIWPTLGLDKTTERMHLLVNYAPGFTFYQRVTSLNQTNQSFSSNFKYRFTPTLSLAIGENFQKTSNLFDQPNPLSAGTVSGGVPVSAVAIVAPAANLLSNLSSAQLAYQISDSSMIGGGGNYAIYSYAQPDQVQGLFDSRVASGSFFYSTRVRERLYLGASYQYQNFLSFQTNSPSTDTQTQTVFGFLTMNVTPNFSVSFSAGPQYYTTSQALIPNHSSWQPMTMVSLNWQSKKTSIAASYSRTVSAGLGLNGSFNSNNFNISINRQLNRDWTAGISGGYSNLQDLTPVLTASGGGGHTLLGTASAQRTFNDHMNVQFGYNWIHQNYPGIQTIATDPNVNRVFVTFNFTFRKPLQR
jgi:hypothetical protein